MKQRTILSAVLFFRTTIACEEQGLSGKGLVAWAALRQRPSHDVALLSATMRFVAAQLILDALSARAGSNASLLESLFHQRQFWLCLRLVFHRIGFLHAKLDLPLARVHIYYGHFDFVA